MKPAHLAIVVALLPLLVSAQEVPYGDQFQVNDYITGRQEIADIALDD
jgi:hypothetical protein